jgi:hypothetical protein
MTRRFASWPVRCFRAIAVGLATCAAADATPGAGWRSETYPDPMHKGGAIVAAEQSTKPEDGVSVTTIVRCWSATAEVDVRFVLNNGQWATGEVRWQFDRGALRTARWRLSPDANALVVPVSMQKDILRGLRTAKELSLSLNQERSFRVSLVGSSQSIDAVQKLCQH